MRPPDGKAPRQAAFLPCACAATASTDWSRRLVAENVLTPADLIWPMFVIEGRNKRMPVDSMPGVDRLSVDLAVEAAEEARGARHSRVALFPYTGPKLRTDDGARGLQSPTIWSAAPPAPSARPGSTSACCSTWRSTPTPATATTA